MIRILLINFFMILLATPIYASSSSSQLDKSLQDINSSFINAHSAARKFDLAEGPIILYRNGQLILIKNDTKITANVIFQTYHTFKVFAHIPVAIYLMLSPQGEGPIESKNLQLLRSYYKKLEYVHKNMHQITLNSTELKKQKIILSRSIEFLKAILDNKKFNNKELISFTQGMLPFINANIESAARNQLDAIHWQVMAWKSEMAPEYWKKLRVAIQGAVLARNGDLTKQYFKRLLDIKKEGLQLVYKELYFPPTPMLTLLATRSVDRGISVAIFNNPDRMFRDVLSDAAASYLRTMKFD
ncbi:hypothetical protein HOD02_01600, partial [bacterium]|nr:hypothetical protein [bacterium]